eukprot:TRINITY_DN64336_c0_g1_i1.p1 TRINITY_DN64336_c0_g1~~TRINITY_DN64336_c0_g1_i1.p1  ORF type:complete len:750 (+),score=123.01 TRINITY_DN64336_c0_g1_i1:47-2296(+)
MYLPWSVLRDCGVTKVSLQVDVQKLEGPAVGLARLLGAPAWPESGYAGCSLLCKVRWASGEEFPRWAPGASAAPGFWTSSSEEEVTQLRVIGQGAQALHSGRGISLSLQGEPVAVAYDSGRSACAAEPWCELGLWRGGMVSAASEPGPGSLSTTPDTDFLGCVRLEKLPSPAGGVPLLDAAGKPTGALLVIESRWIGLAEDGEALPRLAEHLGSCMLDAALRSAWLDVASLARQSVAAGWAASREDGDRYCTIAAGQRDAEHGCTALHLACCACAGQRQGVAAAAAALLECRADVHALAPDGDSPLSAALRARSPLMYPLLARAGPGVAEAAGLKQTAPLTEALVDWDLLRKARSYSLILVVAELVHANDRDEAPASLVSLAKKASMTSALGESLTQALLRKHPAMALRALKLMPSMEAKVSTSDALLLERTLKMASEDGDDDRWLEAAQVQLARGGGSCAWLCRPRVATSLCRALRAAPQGSEVANRMRESYAELLEITEDDILAQPRASASSCAVETLTSLRAETERSCIDAVDDAETNSTASTAPSQSTGDRSPSPAAADPAVAAWEPLPTLVPSLPPASMRCNFMVSPPSSGLQPFDDSDGESAPPSPSRSASLPTRASGDEWPEDLAAREEHWRHTGSVRAMPTSMSAGSAGSGELRPKSCLSSSASKRTLKEVRFNLSPEQLVASREAAASAAGDSQIAVQWHLLPARDCAPGSWSSVESRQGSRIPSRRGGKGSYPPNRGAR